jgi:hypothetical protein
MPIVDAAIIERRLTPARLHSYRVVCGGDRSAALALYDWNTQLSGALHEVLGMFEVVFRNALDRELRRLNRTKGRSSPWYQATDLFPGRQGQRAADEVRSARQRATRWWARPEEPGKVIAELNFGFWRFLCARHYLTSMWVPALAHAFPGHPAGERPDRVRSDVESRVQRLHFVRNRVAHHEPLHERDIGSDYADLLVVCGWICSESRRWIDATSRVRDVLAKRPR